LSVGRAPVRGARKSLMTVWSRSWSLLARTKLSFLYYLNIFIVNELKFIKKILRRNLPPVVDNVVNVSPKFSTNTTTSVASSGTSNAPNSNVLADFGNAGFKVDRRHKKLIDKMNKKCGKLQAEVLFIFLNLCAFFHKACPKPKIL